MNYRNYSTLTLALVLRNNQVLNEQAMSQADRILSVDQRKGIPMALTVGRMAEWLRTMFEPSHYAAVHLNGFGGGHSKQCAKERKTWAEELIRATFNEINWSELAKEYLTITAQMYKEEGWHPGMLPGEAPYTEEAYDKLCDLIEEVAC